MPNVTQDEAVQGHLGRLRSMANEIEIECDLFGAQMSREQGMPAAGAPRDTIPSPPAQEATSPDLPPIPRGKARLHLAGAAVDVLIAFDRFRMVAEAVARALDTSTRPSTPPGGQTT